MCKSIWFTTFLFMLAVSPLESVTNFSLYYSSIDGDSIVMPEVSMDTTSSVKSTTG